MDKLHKYKIKSWIDNMKNSTSLMGLILGISIYIEKSMIANQVRESQKLMVISINTLIAISNVLMLWITKSAFDLWYSLDRTQKYIDKKISQKAKKWQKIENRIVNSLYQASLNPEKNQKYINEVLDTVNFTKPTSLYVYILKIDNRYVKNRLPKKLDKVKKEIDELYRIKMNIYNKPYNQK